MSGQPDFKPPRRVRNRTATTRACLVYPECLACDRPASNGHHVLAVGRGQTGDDVLANIIPLCGTGTTGCHGAYHGSPYVVWRGTVRERRTGDWVARRIGERLDERRPDVVAYVLGKLGQDAGLDFLARRYHYQPSVEGATLPA